MLYCGQRSKVLISIYYFRNIKAIVMLILLEYSVSLLQSVSLTQCSSPSFVLRLSFKV